MHDANNYNYAALEDGSIEITCYKGEDTKVIIPDEIDGKKVTGIGNKAFFKCSNLTDIIIPRSVTKIGDSAFFECSSLKDVYYAGSKNVWRKIVKENTNECLTNATIHYNVKSIIACQS